MHNFWQDGIDVFDPNTGETAHYETYRTGSARQYSDSACARIQSHWCSDNPDMISEGDSNPDSSDEASPYSDMLYIDDDDEYEDVVRCAHTISLHSNIYKLYRD
jgi:hypothetical protein